LCVTKWAFVGVKLDQGTRTHETCFIGLVHSWVGHAPPAANGPETLESRLPDLRPSELVVSCPPASLAGALDPGPRRTRSARWRLCSVRVRDGVCGTREASTKRSSWCGRHARDPCRACRARRRTPFSSRRASVATRWPRPAREGGTRRARPLRLRRRKRTEGGCISARACVGWALRWVREYDDLSRSLSLSRARSFGCDSSPPGSAYCTGNLVSTSIRRDPGPTRYFVRLFIIIASKSISADGSTGINLTSVRVVPTSSARNQCHSPSSFLRTQAGGDQLGRARARLMLQRRSHIVGSVRFLLDHTEFYITCNYSHK
jgi:hypothetical protein